MTQNTSLPQKGERGMFYVIYPGVLEATIPLNSIRNIEQSENILKFIRETIQEREGDIKAMDNPDLQESDLLCLTELGWVLPA